MPRSEAFDGVFHFTNQYALIADSLISAGGCLRKLGPFDFHL